MAEIIELFSSRTEEMKARADLRKLLSGMGAAEPGGGPATGNKRQKKQRRAARELPGVTIRGDRPQTFIFKGDLYITIGGIDDAQK